MITAGDTPAPSAAELEAVEVIEQVAALLKEHHWTPAAVHSAVSQGVVTTTRQLVVRALEAGQAIAWFRRIGHPRCGLQLDMSQGRGCIVDVSAASVQFCQALDEALEAL